MEKRLVYLDRLKVFLTALVVLHHTAIMYGGAGSWYYYERTDNAAVTALLSTLTAVDQTFFMGLFFFVSGYVTPASYDRRGGLHFLKARLIRFGIPLLFFMLVIAPLLGYFSSGYSGSMASYLRAEVFPHPLRGIAEFAVGPLWYLEALLIFFLVYAGIRLAAETGKFRLSPPRLTPRLMAGYVAAVAAANFPVRMAFPVGTEWIHLQLGYFPAYIGLFAAGTAAYRGDWLQQLSVDTARRWRWPVVAMVVTLPAGMALGGALEGRMSAFMGGVSWQAAFYALLDPLLGLGITYMLLVWFRERWNGAPTRTTRWLSGHAFAVYILHALFVTCSGFAFRSLAWNPLLKFAVAGGIALLLVYAAAALVRKIPGSSRVV
ncbi:acyltransferase family protein [Cohnella caldifontis]|uniref:acyltransferase family protein n=1 Tax=Cohnella caldifontis TaxID=3027471 RepID=UPI0023ED8E0C|nr:acyltransferase [Cohnella sp. YIM B05605]